MYIINDWDVWSMHDKNTKLVHFLPLRMFSECTLSFSFFCTNAAMYFRCGQNLLTMYMLKYIEMSSLMHIVLIDMYVECTMKAHKLYIWLPDECTLNAHCNVHCLFATAHIKLINVHMMCIRTWFLYVLLNALFTLQCHRRDVHSMCPEFAYNGHSKVHFNVVCNAHCFDFDV